MIEHYLCYNTHGEPCTCDTETRLCSGFIVLIWWNRIKQQTEKMVKRGHKSLRDGEPLRTRATSCVSSWRRKALRNHHCSSLHGVVEWSIMWKSHIQVITEVCESCFNTTLCFCKPCRRQMARIKCRIITSHAFCVLQTWSAQVQQCENYTKSPCYPLQRVVQLNNCTHFYSEEKSWACWVYCASTTTLIRFLAGE